MVAVRSVRYESDTPYRLRDFLGKCPIFCEVSLLKELRIKPQLIIESAQVDYRYFQPLR